MIWLDDWNGIWLAEVLISIGRREWHLASKVLIWSKAPLWALWGPSLTLSGPWRYQVVWQIRVLTDISAMYSCQTTNGVKWLCSGHAMRQCMTVRGLLWCLLLSVVDSGDKPMDIVDGVLAKQLLPSELWSDMIIFSSVTPSKIHSL